MHVMQPSFIGGEFSPSLHSRVDVQKFQTGLKKAKNFILHPHGGASNRSGTHFLNKTKYPLKKCRLLPFEFSIEQSLALEFGDLYIRFHKNDGLILNDFEEIYEIVTPYLEDDLADIKIVQSADVVYIFHPKYPIKTLTRYFDNGWSFENHPVINGPFRSNINYTEVNILEHSGYPGNVPHDGVWRKETIVAIQIMDSGTADTSFYTEHVGSYFKVTQAVQSKVYSATYTANGATIKLPVKKGWKLSTSGEFGAILRVKVTDPASLSAAVTIQTIVVNSLTSEVQVNGVVDEFSLIFVEVAAFGGGTCYLTLTTDAYNLDSIYKNIGFISADQFLGEVVSEAVSGTSGRSWQEGSWSEYRGYPSCGGFYQDRLIAACTKSEPQTLWTSKIGNYSDFGITSPLEDTDAVSVNLPSRKLNAIENLVVLSDILTLTTGSECSVGEVGGVFSPTTVRSKIHGYRGSSGTEPVIVGNRAIVVQAMGSVIRDYAYDYNSDGYQGIDLSIYSSHLVKDFGIVEMAYQQEPNSIIWMVRSDGKLLSLTYMKEQDVVAWSWHETDGLFESICTIPGNGQNDIYFIVNRDGQRFVERLSKRLALPGIEECFFLDSALTYRGTPTKTITGLSHLNGKEVSALANGHVVTNLLVTSGAITLTFDVTLAHIGLPYESDLETLEIQLPTNDGSSSGRYSKVSEVSISFLNSRGGAIGPDENSLDDVQDASPGYLADPKDMFTGKYTQVLNSGFEKGSQIFFRQSLPLPTTILSIIPKVELGDRR